MCYTPPIMGLWLVVALLQDAGLRAGAFAIDITPPAFPISVNGGMADRTATKANDPLNARCLVLDDGRTKVAIVVVDSCMVPREVFDAAKEKVRAAAGIPVDRQLMSATHTHTAPTLTGVFQSEPDEAYRTFLAGKIAEGVGRAAKALEPARIGWAVGRDATQVFNRRWHLKEDKTATDPFGRARDRVRMNPGYQNPDVVRSAGPIDPEIPIVALQRPDGRPLAVLANYSLHYVGGVPELSADYFALFASRLAENIKAPPEFLAIMSNGTSGNINNVDFANPAPGARKPGEQAGRVADSVARAAQEALGRVVYRPSASIAMREVEIELRVRKPDAADLARAKEILAAAGAPPLKGHDQVYARESVLLADYPDTVKLKLQALRIGDMAICAIPCETFVEIGLELKALSPLKPTFTISLANGYNGYLPTAEHHALGGYETWRARSSYLEEGAARKITDALLKLLAEVDAGSR